MFNAAAKFAELMDANKYAEAGNFLAENCRYHYGQEIIVGKEAILRTYISNYNSAAKKLDEIIFSSDVVEIDDSTFKLSYLDKIRKGSVWHDHRCEQTIRFERGKIVEIKHFDLPGEAEALKKFNKKVGLS